MVDYMKTQFVGYHVVNMSVCMEKLLLLYVNSCAVGLSVWSKHFILQVALFIKLVVMINEWCTLRLSSLLNCIYHVMGHNFNIPYIKLKCKFAD